MEQNRLKGLIYKVMPYKENSKLVFVYTKKGKLTLVAQGAQKVNHNDRILTQYLNLIEFDEKEKNMYRLSNGKLLNEHTHIKNDYHQTKKTALMLEIIDKIITENDEHTLIYQNLIEALETLETGYLSFAVKILPIIGYHLNLTPDGRKVKGFSLLLNRLIYEDESHPISLDVKETTELLKLYFPYQSDKIGKLEKIKKLESFIYQYYQAYTQTELKTLR
ncbi:MAG: DNA repair protein RecO [Candidatus Phytoplasma sp.]|nr:DNA repair protein RecO [Phytoplasma sp.]